MWWLRLCVGCFPCLSELSLWFVFVVWACISCFVSLLCALCVCVCVEKARVTAIVAVCWYLPPSPSPFHFYPVDIYTTTAFTSFSHTFFVSQRFHPSVALLSVLPLPSYCLFALSLPPFFLLLDFCLLFSPLTHSLTLSYAPCFHALLSSLPLITPSFYPPSHPCPTYSIDSLLPTHFIIHFLLLSLPSCSTSPLIALTHSPYPG